MNPQFLKSARLKMERRTGFSDESLYVPDLRDTSPAQRGKLVADLMRLDPENIQEYLALFIEGTYEGQIAKDGWRTKAERDALTGLFNRGAFDASLKQEVARTSLHKANASLLQVDMDLFKSINDQFGHPAGDAVLKKAADLLEHNTRDGDVVARTGGDEFSIILRNANPKDSYQIVSRLNRVFSKETQDWNGVALPVRASIGFVGIKAGQSVEQVIKAADDAMYRAKHLNPQRQQRGAVLKVA